LAELERAELERGGGVTIGGGEGVKKNPSCCNTLAQDNESIYLT
jgi:hypothetical protein